MEQIAMEQVKKGKAKTEYANAVKNRYEFAVIFDVENGNPNGDPDAGNMPRLDAQTNLGIVSDVCLKRKIRNYVELVKKDEPEYNILIKQDDTLNSKFAKAYDELSLKKGQGKSGKKEDVEAARKFICKNYFDVRTFGAVMNTGDDWCGIVRGPIQINFARSIDPIFVQNITITRSAITNEKDKGDNNTMGRKQVIPYALYKTEGYVSAMLAQTNTGFSEADLELFWEAVVNMFEHDHSAARGKMTVRKLIVFKHSSALGDAPSHILFDKIDIKRKAGIEVPRNYKDYTVAIDKSAVPGVEIIEKL
jgi:CRISPR-associated protein Csd2